MSTLNLMSGDPMDISKGVFIAKILQDVVPINAFFSWLDNTADPNATATKRAWDNSFNVTVGSPFVENLVASLAPVLGTAVADRYAAMKAQLIAAQTPAPAPAAPLPMKKYSVPAQTDVNAWLNANIVPAGTVYEVESLASGYEVRTTGMLPAPAVQM